MTITVSEFQTLGASLLERACKLHEEVSIMDAGVVVARLIPERAPGKSWHQLRGAAVIRGDLTQPVMTDDEVAAALQTEAANLTKPHGD